MTGHLKSTPSARCLDTLMKLAGSDIPAPPAPFVTAMKTLVTGSIDMPWQSLMPQHHFRIFFKNVVQETQDVFSRLPFDYYETAWTAGNRVFSALRPVCVDMQAFSSALDSGSTIPGLESFRPKKSGFTHPVVYDRFGTRTGRLTVIEGPNILLLRKDVRGIMRSSFDGGIVASLDFRALEARIVLAEAGRHCAEGDMYDDLATKLFCGRVSRDIVKTAVLSELYGISRSALRARLGVTDDEVDSFIGVIRAHFKTDDLKNRLKKQVDDRGRLANRFGRPIPLPPGADNLILNTYAQSSGVDVSLLGFDNVIQRLGTDGIRPLFVLHDAIILDVRPDRIPDVEGCTTVTVPSYTIPFPLKLEQIA